MILITGAAGFIGAHLHNKLTQTRDVLGIDIRPKPGIIQADIKDLDFIGDMVKAADTVIHLADKVGVETVSKTKESEFRELLDAHLHLIEQCAASGKRLILASTSEVYGSSRQRPMMETDELRLPPSSSGRSLYARSKLLMESFAREAYQKFPEKLLIIRFFNIVGPGQRKESGFVFPNFVGNALRNIPLNIYGSGNQQRCFCHVHDAVHALNSFITHSTWPHQLVNVGADNKISMMELAKRVVEASKSTSEIIFAKGREDESIFYREPDLRRLRQFIPTWSPRNLNEIIHDVIKSEQKLRLI